MNFKIIVCSVKSILESKYKGTIDNNFNLKQKIAENKIKAWRYVGGIEETIMNAEILNH